MIDKIYIILLLASTLFARTDRYRLICRDDPSTTMVVAWEQQRGGNVQIFYGPDDQ